MRATRLSTEKKGVDRIIWFQLIALSLLDAFSASRRKLARKGPIVTILSSVYEGDGFTFRGFMQRECLMCSLGELILECSVVNGVGINLESGLEVGPDVALYPNPGVGVGERERERVCV